MWRLRLAIAVLDSSISVAIRHTARLMEADAATVGLEKVGEVKHLTAAFRKGLATAGVPGVRAGGKTLSIASWEPQGVKGRLGPIDVVVGAGPRFTAFFELKWAHQKNELGWTLWDIYKLAAARIEYGAAGYAIVGAPLSYWDDETIDCSALYCDGDWDSGDVFRRYERAWKDLLTGGTARPLRIPSTIATRLVASEEIHVSPKWELRALAVDVPETKWLDFEGDWPVGHGVKREDNMAADV